MAALSEIIRLNDKDGRKKGNGSSGSDDNSDSISTASSADARPDQIPPPVPTPSTPTNRKRKKSIPLVEPIKKATTTATTTIPEEIPPSNGSTNTPPPPPITNDEYARMKKSFHERKRNVRHGPKLRLKLFGDSAHLNVAATDRTPIFLTDIQHLIMGTVLGRSSPCIPFRWCHIERTNKVAHTVVMFVEGISLRHYQENVVHFRESNKLFEHKLEVIMPPDGGTVEEFVMVSLTDRQSAELIRKYGSLEAAIESTRNQMLLVKAVFPIKGEENGGSTGHKSNVAEEVLCRKQLLLSALQMVDEGYPLPLKGELANRYKDYVLTSDRYAPVTSASPMFGLDCEMCRTSAGMNELTRISIVNEQHESVYETLVRPDNKIVDYLTKFSGITGAMMENVTKTLAEVQQDVRKLLPPDAILVGQSLQSDLVAMRMMHPYVIDTSVIFNISGERRIKSKLQTLSYEFLGEVIQDNPLGHDSIEDCTASLKLTKLKLLKGVDFGDAVLSGRKRANDNEREALSGGGGGGDGGDCVTMPPPTKRVRTTTVISASETNVDYEAYVQSMDGLAAHHNRNIFCHRADSNKAAVRMTKEHVIQSDLTITHLKVTPDRTVDTKLSKTLTKVDRWMANCWESVAPNGLFVVIFGGGGTADAVDSNNGIADCDDGRFAATKSGGDGDHSGVVFLDIKNNCMKK